MATIHRFPPQPAMRPMLRAVDGAPGAVDGARRGVLPRRRYDFAAMVQLLAIDGMCSRSQVDHLRLLATQASLPLPCNLRKWRGRMVTGAYSISTRSIWCAMEVDAWLDGRHTPPAVAVSAPGAVTDMARQDMRERALRIARA